MGNKGSDWSSVFSDEQHAAFWDQTQERWDGNGVVEYQELPWAYLLGATAADTGTAAQPLRLDVIERASAIATAAGPTDATGANAGWPGFATTRPQEPKIDAAGIVPVGTSVLIGGLQIVVYMGLVRLPATIVDVAAGAVSPAAAADDVIAGIMAAFDCGVMHILDARNPKAKAKGHGSVSYGAGRVAVMGPPMETTDGVVDSVLYEGQVPSKDRGWCRFPPVYFDGGGPDRPGQSQSQIKLIHEIPRSTTWPVEANTRFRVEVVCPALIGYQGSAPGGKNCEPPPAPYNRALPPNQRW